ncbi:MAG: AbrB/MazE/SpoVT family DNA-binding domain-containing protein [Oscillospiraceae bacterium]|nr:AbrB/MazE/SpoVT family DNA-binding domain-containing protein [Oscillospiraceae bacterium]
MVTNIVKWGNSQGIRIPKPLLESLDLKDNDMVELIIENNYLVIKKKEKTNTYKTIQERFENYNDEYEPIEIDWGAPVGDEIW